MTATVDDTLVKRLADSRPYDRRLYITWAEFDQTVQRMCFALNEWQPKSVYGKPRGGLVLATALSHALGVPLRVDLTQVNKDTLWVDDLYDTGRTWHKHWGGMYTNPQPSIVWFAREGVQRPECVLRIEDIAPRIWVVFPWETRT